MTSSPLSIPMGAQVEAVAKKERRDRFWSVFGVHNFVAAPAECEHPHGLHSLLGSSAFIVGRGCGDCGWMDGWQ